MAVELVQWIEDRFSLPAVTVPDLVGEDPDLAAQVVRTEWSLGDKPAPNMIRLLESKGVIVFSLARDSRDLDGFSFWHGSRPIIMLNTQKSAERSRMDAAHELGHLVMHREETAREEERQANKFGGAFLMPAADVYKYAKRARSLADLIATKHRWRVALSALVYRFHELEVLSDWNYRTLFIELSRRGYRTTEPDPIQQETSSLLAKVFGYLRENGIGLSRVAADLNWPREYLAEFLLGMGATLVPLKGGRDSSGRRGSGEPDLHLV